MFCEELCGAEQLKITPWFGETNGKVCTGVIYNIKNKIIGASFQKRAMKINVKWETFGKKTM